MKKELQRSFGLAAVLLLFPANAFAGGSLPFADLKELLDQRPSLAQFISNHLDVAEIGSATRIGARVNEELSGSRVAPYEFSAKPKGAEGGFNLLLIIEAETSFLDSNDRKVGVKRAAKIKERFTGIRLRPLTSDER